MAQLFSNNATATLATSVTNVATTITLTTGHGARFNAPTGGDYELLTITDGTNVEIVKVTSRAGDVLTVTRAQEGTTAQVWTAATAQVYAGVTKGTLENFAQDAELTALGLNTGGDAKGTDATNLQSGRTNVANVASASYSVAVGYDSKASGVSSAAVGKSSVASAASALAIGNTASSSASWAIAVGDASSAAANNAVAVGHSASASVVSAVAVGNSSSAAGDYSVTVGDTSSSVAAADYGVSIGYTAKSKGLNAISIGKLAGLEPVASAWQASTTYWYGMPIVDADKIFVCVDETYTGQSGGSKPTFVTTDYGSLTTDNAIQWMYFNEANLHNYGIAVGDSARSIDSGVAIGKDALSAAEGVTAGTSARAGYFAVAIGSGSGGLSKQSVAVGAGTGCFGGESCYGAVAVGAYARAYGNQYSMALGADAINRIDASWTVSGANIIRKDNADDAAMEHIYFAGTKAVYFSKEIDLKSLNDDIATITVPAGATFYPDELGIVITSATSVTGNPDISFGVTGNTTSLLASTTVTSVAAKNRTVFTPLSKHGVNSLTASVKAAATGTTLKGRFYWVGMLVEDE